MKEETLHRSIVQYLRTVLPHGWIVQHTANKPRSKVAGGIEKAMGAVAGWPDIAIYGMRDEYSFTGRVIRDVPAAWFLEVKTPRGQVRDAQHEVHDRLKDLGFPVAVVRSLDDVRTTISEWGLPSREVAA